jgi:hypothetical protein
MRTTFRGLLLALFVVALAAACTATAAGPGVATLEESQEPGAAPSASPSMSPEDALLAFAECMREHGIDMPDPQFDTTEDGGAVIGIAGGSADIDKDEFREADEACRSLLAAAMPGNGDMQMSPEDEEKLLEFARCMREHGIDFPDPGTGGFVFEAGPEGRQGGIDPEDPDFQAAQEACGELLPGRAGRGDSTEINPGGDAGPGLKVNP